MFGKSLILIVLSSMGAVYAADRPGYGIMEGI